MYICICPYVYGYDSTSRVWPEVCSAWDMTVEIGMVPPSLHHIVRTQSGAILTVASSWSHYDTWWWLHMLIHKCSMTCSCTDVSLCTVLVVLLSAYNTRPSLQHTWLLSDTILVCHLKWCFPDQWFMHYVLALHVTPCWFGLLLQYDIIWSIMLHWSSTITTHHISTYWHNSLW